MKVKRGEGALIDAPLGELQCVHREWLRMGMRAAHHFVVTVIVHHCRFFAFLAGSSSGGSACFAA